jgi:hypothetical protein
MCFSYSLGNANALTWLCSVSTGLLPAKGLYEMPGDLVLLLFHIRGDFRQWEHLLQIGE